MTDHNTTSLQSALGKARGAGSSRSGTHHWWMVRLTSLPLVMLSFYFLWQWPDLVTHDRATLVAWLKQPVPSVAVIVFILSSFYHACLGMEEVIIDYVPREGAKFLLLAVNKIIFSTLAIAAIFAVLKINFGAF